MSNFSSLLESVTMVECRLTSLKKRDSCLNEMDRCDAPMTGRGLYLDPSVGIIGQARLGTISRFV